MRLRIGTIGLAAVATVSAAWGLGGDSSALVPATKGATLATNITSSRPVRAHRELDWSTPHAKAKSALPGWRIAWDRDTDTPTQLMGSSLPIANSVADPVVAESAARAFLAEHAELLAPGATAADFAIINNTLNNDIRSVAFAQVHQGVPVLNAITTFSFKRDRLALISSTALPNVHAAVPTTRLATAMLHGAAESRFSAFGHPVQAASDGPRVIVPIVHPRTGKAPDVEYRAAEVVSVVSTGPHAGRWDVYVDANDGTAFAQRDRLEYNTGTIKFDVPDHDPQHTRSAHTAGHLTLSINGQQVTTDANGVATFSGADPATVIPAVAGPFVKVLNAAGNLVSDSLTLAGGGSVTWSQAADENTDSQLDTFVFVNTTKQFIRDRINPSLGALDTQLEANVNENDTCNAFYDPQGDNLNFFHSGDGCANTGRISDVVFHETGHWLHAHSFVGGPFGVDGSLGEGVADTLAVSITGDQGIGKGFETATPDSFLRDLDPDGLEKKWPQNADGEVHDEGEIYGEAMLDLRKALQDKLGSKDAAINALLPIYYSIVVNANDIPDTIGPALLGDDDDGDLTNGTPNQCEIQGAFNLHGLGDPNLALRLSAPVVDGFNVSVTTIPSLCGDTQSVRAATLSWRLRGGTDAPVTLAPSAGDANTFTAAIPAQAEGSIIEYKMVFTLADGSTRKLPDNAADPYYQMYVGTPTVIYCQDFESGLPSDWNHGGARDEWSVGVPKGLGGDPDVAHGGTGVAGIDLASDGQYRSNSNQSLTTGTIDTSGHSNVHLQYYRWLGVEDGFYDHASITANGTTVWNNFASTNDPGVQGTNHIDAEWRFQDVDVTDQAKSGNVTLSFKLDSDEGAQFGGWTIDDVCLVELKVAPDPVACGNGTVDPGETCDDGNTTDGDGCSATCQDEDPGMDPKDGGGCCSTGTGPGGPALLGILSLGLVLRRRRR